MSTILMGMIILSLSGAMALLWKRKIEELFGFSILLSVSLLYVAGVVGYLSYGVYAVLAVAAIAAAFCLIRILTGFRQAIGNLVTPGLIAFVLLLAWVFVVFRNRLADNYGSFSHWGLEIKNMYVFNQIPNALSEATIYFRNYPPGSALFPYFWLKLTGALNEGDMFRALVVFSVSLLLPMFSQLSWKNWKGIVPLFLLVFAIPLLFNTQAYTTLGIDTLLGCLAAYIIMIGHTQKRQPGDGLIIGLSFFVLPMIKVSGLGLAVLAGAVLLIDWLCCHRFDKWWKVLVAIAAFVLCGVVSQQIWSLYLSQHLPSTEVVGLSGERIQALLANGLEEYHRKSLVTFWEKMINPRSWSGFGGHSYFFWLAAFAIVAVVISQSEDGSHSFALLVATLVGAVAYAVSLLATYWFKFTPSEAERVAECERYFSTYQIFMFAVLAYVLVCMLVKMQRPCGKLWVLALCFLLFVEPMRLYSNTIGYNNFIQGSQISRALKKPSSDVMSSLNSETDRVYYLSQEADDYAYWVIRYEMTPVPMSELPPAAHLAKEDVEGATVDSAQGWMQEIIDQGFTHLYLYRADDTFRVHFSELFAEPEQIQNATLFSIHPNEERPLRFVAH